MAKQGEHGTGKHGHKDAQEPWPHHESESGKKSGGSAQHSASQSHGHSQQHGGSGSEDQSLKSREYRDAQGNVHHHTTTSGSQGKEGSSGGKGQR
jgi:hypothetical protein